MNADSESKGEPDLLNIYGHENMAITASNWNLGFAIKFIEAPVSFYLIQYQNATSRQMTAFDGLCKIPSTMKVLYGIFSDGNSIFGYRRKPWLILGLRFA